MGVSHAVHVRVDLPPNRDSCILYIAGDDLGLLIFLAPSPKYEVYRPASSYLFYKVLEIKLGDLCMLDEQSINCDTSPVFEQNILTRTNQVYGLP